MRTHTEWVTTDHNSETDNTPNPAKMGDTATYGAKTPQNELAWIEAKKVSVWPSAALPQLA